MQRQVREAYDQRKKEWQSGGRAANCAKCHQDVVFLGLRNGHINAQNLRNHCLKLEHNLERGEDIIVCGACEAEGRTEKGWNVAFRTPSINALWKHAAEVHGKDYSNSGIRDICRLTPEGEAAMEEELEECFQLSRHKEAFQRFIETKKESRRAVTARFTKRIQRPRDSEATKAAKSGSLQCRLCQRFFAPPKTETAKLKLHTSHVLRAHVHDIRRLGSHWDVVKQCFP